MEFCIKRCSLQIFIEFLEFHNINDENSGDKNDCHVDSLIDNQFRAPAYTSNEEADNTLQSEVPVTIASCNTNKKHIYTWKKERQTVEIVSFPENNQKKNTGVFSLCNFLNFILMTKRLKIL